MTMMTKNKSEIGFFAEKYRDSPMASNLLDFLNNF